MKFHIYFSQIILRHQARINIFSRVVNQLLHRCFACGDKCERLVLDLERRTIGDDGACLRPAARRLRGGAGRRCVADESASAAESAPTAESPPAANSAQFPLLPSAAGTRPDGQRAGTVQRSRVQRAERSRGADRELEAVDEHHLLHDGRDGAAHSVLLLQSGEQAGTSKSAAECKATSSQARPPSSSSART